MVMLKIEFFLKKRVIICHITKSSKICQDFSNYYFNSLVGIASTGTTGASANFASRCLTDSFAVTNPSGSSANTPALCGTNTGEHSNLG